MKKILLVILSILAILGCSKVDSEQLKIILEKSEISIPFSGTACVNYIIQGADETTEIKTISQDGWESHIEQTDNKSGIIHIAAPHYFETGEIIILVSNNSGQTIMQTLNLVKGYITADKENITLDYNSGKFSVNVQTDLQYSVRITGDYFLEEVENSDNTLTFSYPELELGTKRASIEFINNGNILYEIIVSQKGKYPTITEFYGIAEVNKEYTLIGNVCALHRTNGKISFDLDDGEGFIVIDDLLDNGNDENLPTPGDLVKVRGVYTHSRTLTQCSIIERKKALQPLEQLTINDYHHVSRRGVENILKGSIVSIENNSIEIVDNTSSITLNIIRNYDEYSNMFSIGNSITVSVRNVMYGKLTDIGCIISVEKNEEFKYIPELTIQQYNDNTYNFSPWNKITGKVANILDPENGHVLLEDNGKGLLFVYGITKSLSKLNDKSFSSLQIHIGDDLTIAHYYGGEHDLTNIIPSCYISHKINSVPEKENNPAYIPFSNSISYICDRDMRSYEEPLEVNGEKNLKGIRIGTGRDYGKVILNIPQGTKKIGFYAVSWKQEMASLWCSNGQKVHILRWLDRAISGGSKLQGVTSYDFYIVDVTGYDTLEIETYGLSPRALIFGVNVVE